MLLMHHILYKKNYTARFKITQVMEFERSWMIFTTRLNTSSFLFILFWFLYVSFYFEIYLYPFIIFWGSERSWIILRFFFCCIQISLMALNLTAIYFLEGYSNALPMLSRTFFISLYTTRITQLFSQTLQYVLQLGVR